MKVKLTKLFHPNISISTTENGGRGTHFAKFLISPFQWGLTHSAMWLPKHGSSGTFILSFSAQGALFEDCLCFEEQRLCLKFLWIADEQDTKSRPYLAPGGIPLPCGEARESRKHTLNETIFSKKQPF